MAPLLILFPMVAYPFSSAATEAVVDGSTERVRCLYPISTPKDGISVSLKAFDYGTIEPALSGTVRQVAKIQSGLASDKAKEITKAIKDSKLKVQGQIQGEQVRVLGKSKDELQSAIAFLKGKDFGIDLQFANYR